MYNDYFVYEGDNVNKCVCKYYDSINKIGSLYYCV